MKVHNSFLFLVFYFGKMFASVFKPSVSEITVNGFSVFGKRLWWFVLGLLALQGAEGCLNSF